jgi:hypothetical protein
MLQFDVTAARFRRTKTMAYILYLQCHTSVFVKTLIMMFALVVGFPAETSKAPARYTQILHNTQ